MNFLPTEYDLEKLWKKVSAPISHPDFTTHSNYINCLKILSDKLAVTINLSQLTSIKKSPIIRKKVKLIKLTEENVREEYQKICQFKDYSQICVSWIPVKSYYLFFNLLLLLIYLTEGREKWLGASHGDLHDKLKDLIKQQKLVFNERKFNKIYSPREILSWDIPTGGNIRITNRDYDLLRKQTAKILLRYKKEEFKRIRNIKSLREPKKSRFLNTTTINLCEFFYWYRIKANYRDMEFIDSKVSTDNFYDFYKNYYFLTINFFKALKPAINNLAISRINERIL